MSNMIKNTFILFSRHKEYVSTIIKTPILMLLVMSFVLSFQSKVNIAFINDGDDKFGAYMEQVIEDTDLIKILDVKEEEIESSIQSGKIEFAVVLGADDEISVIKAKDSSIAEYAEYVLSGAALKYETEENLTLTQNDVGKKGIPINNSLGMIIFKMIAAASLLAELIILEKKNGMIQRIFISKTKLSTYLTGRGIVFFLHMLIFIACYFLTAFIFRFDFGMKAPLRLAVIFAVMGVFTTAFGMLLAALLKDEGAVWNVGVLVLLPTSILSGALFPFKAMPKLLKTIGGLFPQRWITSAVEILQDGGSLQDAAGALIAVLAASLVMFVISSVKLSKAGK